MTNTAFPRLEKKIVLEIGIELLTGLHIGGNDVGIGIGGADKIVVRDGRGLPYIPGSSLKGKIRSLLERAGAGGARLSIEERGGQPSCGPCQCGSCAVCAVFGVSAAEERRYEPGRPYTGAARLLVRDASLSRASREELESLSSLDMPYTQVKTEVAIDRLTSMANPRRFERVPAGAKFETALVLGVQAGDPAEEHVALVLQGLQLVAWDHVGGQGSRGYGAVKVEVTAARELGIEGDGLVHRRLTTLGPRSIPFVFEISQTATAAA